MTMTEPLLVVRALTDDERAAEAEEPRCGTWFGDLLADGRVLGQDDTDALIRRELFSVVSEKERGELFRLCGRPRDVRGAVRDIPRLELWHQRGGIDSDPLVRVLAYRVWGERDQRWFEDRGVRKGEAVTAVARLGGESGSDAALAREREHVIGHAWHDAAPGQRVQIDDSPYAVAYQVSGRPRRA